MMKGDPRRARGLEHHRRGDGARVIVAGSLDIALRIFKHQVERANIFDEVRRREGYTPPGEARRMKSRKARARAAKSAARRARAPIAEWQGED